MTPSFNTSCVLDSEIASIQLDEIPLEALPSDLAFSEGRRSSTFTISEPDVQTQSSIEMDTEARNVSQLPPVDTGRQAWGFVLGATFCEGLTWGV